MKFVNASLGLLPKNFLESGLTKMLVSSTIFLVCLFMLLIVKDRDKNTTYFLEKTFLLTF
jgi:hypothetical protein